MTQLQDRTLRKLHTVANLRNCEARRGHMARSYVGWSELRNRLSRLLRLGHFWVGARVPCWSHLHFQCQSGPDQPAHGPAPPVHQGENHMPTTISTHARSE